MFCINYSTILKKYGFNLITNENKFKTHQFWAVRYDAINGERIETKSPQWYHYNTNGNLVASGDNIESLENHLDSLENGNI